MREVYEIPPSSISIRAQGQAALRDGSNLIINSEVDASNLLIYLNDVLRRISKRLDENLSVNGIAKFQGLVDANQNTIKNVADAVQPQDALNLRTGDLRYAPSQLGQIQALTNVKVLVNGIPTSQSGINLNSITPFGGGLPLTFAADGGAPTGIVVSSPLTTKGDLLTATAAALARLGVGSDTQVLTADSTQALGIKWATPASGATVVSTTGSHASVGTTNVIATTPAASTVYTLKFYLYQDGAGTGATGDAQVSVTVSWTDPSSTAQSATSSPIFLANSIPTDNFTDGTIPIVAKASTAITYSTTWTNAAGASVQPTYGVFVWAFQG